MKFDAVLICWFQFCVDGKEQNAAETETKVELLASCMTGQCPCPCLIALCY